MYSIVWLSFHQDERFIDIILQGSRNLTIQKSSYEERKRLHELNSIVDENLIKREYEKNEALKYNSKMIKDQKNAQLK